MGSRSRLDVREREHPFSYPDHESGQLSIDFITGLSIFMIAFIIVATMTSGLLIGIQSRTIDYDAVAYRTGVILAEDPGEIEETVGLSYIAPDRYAWDLIYSQEYWDQYHQSNVLRMGLMIPRYYYDSPPRVLMDHKIMEFFNSTKYSHDYYQDKTIFGGYPYRFNISLTMLDDPTHPFLIGDQVPDQTPTGYIRRVVMVKDPTGLTINNIFLENGSGSLKVTYDFRNISEGNPAYMIYPSLEPTVINMTCFPGPEAYNLTYLQVCSPTCEDPEPTPPTIVLKNYTNPAWEARFPALGLGMEPIPVNNSSYFIVEPGYFTRRYFPNIGPVDTLDIKMRINSTNPDVTAQIGGAYEYYYTIASGAEYSSPPLSPGVLEVRVW